MNDFLQSIRNQSKDKRYQQNNRPRRPYDNSGSSSSGSNQSQSHHNQQQQQHNQQNGSGSNSNNYHRNQENNHHRNNNNDNHRNKYHQRPKQDFGQRDKQDFGQRDEQLTTIKELLESMVAHQAQTLEIHERRAIAEERKAEAIEDIASIISSLAGADFSGMDKVVVSGIDAVTREFEGELDLDNDDDYYDAPMARETKAYTKDEILAVIQKMRQEGATYNEVAAHLTDIGLPTFSGRGKWHAQTIHRLCQQD